MLAPRCSGRRIRRGHALHVGVERIGRFLQVFDEDASGVGSPLWETTTSAYTRAHPRSGPMPLFPAGNFPAATLNVLMLLGPCLDESGGCCWRSSPTGCSSGAD